MNGGEQRRVASPNGSSNRSAVLVADGLRKYYGPRQALKGLSFSLQAGHVLGFLGPNGAGKTTAIRILTTMMEPSSGHFTVDGITSEHPDSIRRRIGVLPENLGFPKHFTAIEYLTFFGQLHGLPARAARDKARQLLEDVGLGQRMKSLITSYSHGMRQRTGIARALINDPSVVFLDEPTLGLDPRGQKELLDLVQRVARERNAGVILCSHALSEIEAVCDDVVILSSGQVVTQGPVAEVVGRASKNVVRLQVPPESVDRARRLIGATRKTVSVVPADDSGGWLRVELAEKNGGSLDSRDRNSILEALTRHGIPVLSFEAEGGRLRDVFLQVTEEAIK